MASLSAGTGVSTPPPPFAPPRRGPSPPSGWDRRGLVAAVLLLVAVVLAGLALANPWWTESASFASGTSAQTELYPGTSVTQSCTSSDGVCLVSSTNGAGNYTTFGWSALGGWYVAVEALTLVAMVLGTIGSIFMVQGAGHFGWGRWQFHTSHLLALLLGASLVLLPTAVAVAQPGALQSGYGPESSVLLPQISSTDCGASTPNDSFWNSCTAEIGGQSVDFVWGAGWGWYLSIFAGLCFLLAGMLFLSSGAGAAPAASRERRRAATDRGVEVSPWVAVGPGTGGASEGADDPRVEGSTLRFGASAPRGAGTGRDLQGGTRICRACGHHNPEGSALCSRCHALVDTF